MKALHAYVIVAIKTRKKKTMPPELCLEAIAAPFSEQNTGRKE